MIALLVVSALAAPPAGGCEAAVAQALARHAGLPAAEAAAAYARARAEVADAWPSPELRARGGAPGFTESLRVGARFDIPRSGRGAADRAAGQERLAEGALLAVEVAAETRRAHLRLRWARRRLARAEARARWAAALEAADEARASAGMIIATELAVRRYDTLEARDAIDEARLEVERADAALARWTGGGAVGEGACAPPTGAPGAHPVVEAAEAGAKAIEAGTLANASGFWPEFVEVAWDRYGAGENRALVSLGLTLFGPGDTDGERQAAEQAGRARVAAARQAVDDEVARAQAILAAEIARRDALSARPDPGAAVLTQARSLQPGAPATIALEVAAAARAARLEDAAWAVEAARVELARALGGR